LKLVTFYRLCNSTRKSHLYYRQTTQEYSQISCFLSLHVVFCSLINSGNRFTWYYHIRVNCKTSTNFLQIL